MARLRRMLAVLAVGLTLWLADSVRDAPAEDSSPGDGRPRPEAEAPALPDLPRGAEELLGLGVLAAILYGLRVAQLGARRDHRSP